MTSLNGCVVVGGDSIPSSRYHNMHVRNRVHIVKVPRDKPKNMQNEGYLDRSSFWMSVTDDASCTRITVNHHNVAG